MFFKIHSSGSELISSKIQNQSLTRSVKNFPIQRPNPFDCFLFASSNDVNRVCSVQFPATSLLWRVIRSNWLSHFSLISVPLFTYTLHSPRCKLFPRWHVDHFLHLNFGKSSFFLRRLFSASEFVNRWCFDRSDHFRCSANDRAILHRHLWKLQFVSRHSGSSRIHSNHLQICAGGEVLSGTPRSRRRSAVHELSGNR